MISASGHWSWQHPHMVILITSWVPRWVVWLAASASQGSWIVIFARLLWTWSLSHACISSWQASLLWLLVDLSNTVLSQSPSSLSKCLMPRTWCVQLILAMDVTWQPLHSSEAVCPLPVRCGSAENTWLYEGVCRSPLVDTCPRNPAYNHVFSADARRTVSRHTPCPQRRWMSKCSMSKIRTHPIFANGSRTILRQVYATFHQRDWRWLLLSQVTRPQFRKCSHGILHRAPNFEAPLFSNNIKNINF